ncbi:hypothetical protein [Streptomyces sp. ITFR-16]|uniref:hypothetical protein n=1 Tax=Streptomyces sp. ITFR-16 TaxID=3075198 RepID=UPI00288B4BDA|nr:hypothetical protein [Streptomyces sp. ITFR-16]WNI24829.1 hypothetical protein RLT58_24370 [Streptomyces sp. ITFR-16]
MNPHRKIRSAAGPIQGPSRPVQGGLTVAVLVLLPLLAVAGSDGLRAALDFTTGVLSLVSLTAAVGWGLLATDRLFLSTRQRLVGQAVHRTAAAASLGFLLLHVTVKVSLGHVALLGALIPFGLGVGGTAGLIGFGSLAGLLMVVAAATGALRSAFASPGRIAGRWRALHALSYPAWCAALVHGLYAGRPPATWVVVMYSLSLVAVAAVLALRMLPPPLKRRIAALVTALIRPDALPAEPDPVVRGTPLPGADSALVSGVRYGAGGAGMDGLGDPPRATPLPSSFERPRTTLPAPAPPLYEAPPRSADRLTTDPLPRPSGVRTGPGPGISAGYRAVSLAAETGGPQQPGGRWPSPSPSPPTQAPRPPHEPYASPEATAPLPSAPPVPSLDDTAPLPGPLYPPPAGEPWNAPAGDRP